MRIFKNLNDKTTETLICIFLFITIAVFIWLFFALKIVYTWKN